jgi:hypothetical protein
MGEATGPQAWVTTLSDPDDNYFQLISPMDMTPQRN